MTKRNLFTAAHAITRQTIKRGDDYRTTFGACLRLLTAAAKGDLGAIDALFNLGRDAHGAANVAIDRAERTIDAGYNTNVAIERAIDTADAATANLAAIAAALVDAAATLTANKANAKTRREATDAAATIASFAADAQLGVNELAA